MGGSGRRREEADRGRKGKLSVIDRQSQCLWRLENHQGDGEWFSFGFLLCLVVLITVRASMFYSVCECVLLAFWEKVRERM